MREDPRRVGPATRKQPTGKRFNRTAGITRTTTSIGMQAAAIMMLAGRFIKTRDRRVSRLVN